jgi:hypothetical protein
MFRRLLTLAVCLGLLAACAAPSTSAPTLTPAQTADLSGLKSYVQTQSEALHASIVTLQGASNRYYELAKGANFDYAALWAGQPDIVRQAIGEARTAFITANPQYERMEGAIAGTPSLSDYDVILDAGVSGADGSPDAVPFDLTLPDGRVLPKPGNLFEVTEAALWGSDPAYVIAGLAPDMDGDGQASLGDAMPDANVLKGAADAFEKYTADLVASTAAWQPNQSEAFGALIANVPTFSDFMESWKASRFVAGSASTERGFVSTSRLSDLSDNILSWQTIYAGLSPQVQTVAPQQDAQIIQNLADLRAYVSGLHAQEQAGKRFSPEEADQLTAEGQDRATGIAGQITQAAARLGVSLPAP